MKNSLKIKLIIAAIFLVIIITTILIVCGIISSLSFGSLLVVVISFLVGIGIGAYVYKIYSQLKKDNVE